MVDFLGFVIGMSVLFGVLYFLVYPITESFARGRLETATGVRGKNINPESIPIRYFSFFGSLIFTIIGFMLGVLLGMYFIGISLNGRDLPGVFSLIVASVSGSLLLAQPANAGFVPYSMGFLFVLIGISWALINQHDAKTMQWLPETPVTAGTPATPAPVSSQLPLPRPQGSATRPPVLPDINRFCTSCGNRVLKSQNFCDNCGKTLNK
jgi:hypothetical protein